jgi:hypothetical protein
MRRDALVREPASAPPAPALVEAADAVTRLLAGWDEGLAAASLDPDGLRSSWLGHLREDFSAIAERLGACSREGSVSSEEPTRGRFRLACARGALELELLLTPAVPARVQAVHVREERPPGERLDGVAQGLARALASWDDAAAALFDPSLDLRRLKNALEGLGLEHGRCSLDRPLWSDGQNEARYRFACSEAPLELGFRLDPNGSSIVRLTSNPVSATLGAGAPLCSDERVLSE